MYNNEIAENSNRGKLGCVAGLFWTIGTFYTCSVGSVTNVRTLTLLCTLSGIFYLLLSNLLVESPAFLASKGKKIEAIKSLEVLRRHKTAKDIELEYELIEKTANSNTDNRGKFSDLLKTKATKKATIISITIQVAQQISGVLIVIFHIPIIFQDADVKVPGNIVAICINLIQVIVFFIPTFLVDHIGKRPLLLFSTAFCSITMFFLASYFYLKHLEIPIIEDIIWLPVILVILFISGYCLGLGSLALVIISELYPTDLKPIGIGICLVVCELVMILVVFTYPLISEISADVLMIGVGSMMAWIGPVLPRLKSNDAEINPLGTPLTTLQVSILSATPLVGLVFGTLILAKVSERLGRKKTLTYCAIGNLLFLCILAFSSNIYCYYIALFLNGLMLDGIYMNVFIYNNEIAENCNRGKFGCVAGLCWSVGAIYCYVIGSMTSIRTLTLFCTIPAIIHLLSSILLIETPSFLASKGKHSEAMQSLELLRQHKNEKEVEIEYKSIENTLQQISNTNVKFSDLFQSKATKMALIISATIEITQQISGVMIVNFHIPVIFQDADVKISGNIVAIGINLIQFLVFIIPTFLVDRVGKRPLLLFSSAFCSLTMFFLALYFYLKHLESPLVDGIVWIPVVCAILFISGHCLGLGPLPLVVVSELFPTELKPIGVGTSLILSELVMILVVFTYPLISEISGIYCCMFSYSACSLIGFIVLYSILPETKDKSLLEIQDILSR
ncbi:unnamed protein product [Psylliodes chrysocephalus]|uniref:Major facilitator superfamily (MFS) profile domain-containing protein n=1 Tax=Psylliodes chrysocephalus TaxID=3402493 RepID=A0A9P0CJM4_9CUCU|nr:unnamed protein product [Psylliodes chrysocephala]